MENIESMIKDGILVIANPGTGKTTALADRVVELLKTGDKEEEILCLTFTEKASSEMQERIEKKIKDLNVNADPKKITISTFHSYAYNSMVDRGCDYNVLGNNIIRFSIYKSFEQNKALNYSTNTIVSEIVPKVENAIRYVKSFGITPDLIDINNAKSELERIYKTENIQNITLEENKKFLEYFVQAYEKYERSKPEGYIDYNDMLLNFLKLKNTKIFKWVLVDELQDVNEEEAKIALQSGEHIFLVGDRKQSIFGFQGGSIKNFKLFINDDKIEKKKLFKNHRSGQKILDYAKTHFLNNTKDPAYNYELMDLTNDKNIKADIELIVTNTEYNACIKKVQELSQELLDETIAIVTRTNAQLIEISKLLDLNRIEYSTTASSATSASARDEILTFLKGLLYDDERLVISALFTLFSGVSLKNAFKVSELYNDQKLTFQDKSKLAKPFFDMKTSVNTIQQLLQLFERIIIPICTSINKEYYLTAITLMNNIKEFIETIPTPTKEDLFNYLSITEESFVELGKTKNITLTTVHKAKGLEFDNVIYLPKTPPAKYSFIDAVVNSIIKAAKNIDVREELEEESLRVDFVAFTRAKKGLYIIVNDRLAKRYDSELIRKKNMDDLEAYLLPAKDQMKYSNAFALFVNGRYDEAKKVLEQKEDWLRDLIYSYFSSLDTFSYSLIEHAQDPYEFLKYEILSIPIFNKSMELGSKVHGIATKLFKNSLNEKDLNDEEKKYLQNIKEIYDLITQKYNATQISSEESLETYLNRLFEEDNDTAELLKNVKKSDLIKFKARLDAVFKTKNGKYLIIDYKTDKNDEYASHHRRQLAVYKKLYALKHSIKEDVIEIAIAYVGLKGKINIDRFDYKLDSKQPALQQIKTFEDHTNKVLEYMNDPEKFITELLNSKKYNEELLYKRIVHELTQK